MPKVLVACDSCGKAFERSPGHLKRNKQNYCSMACRNQGLKGRAGPRSAAWTHADRVVTLYRDDGLRLEDVAGLFSTSTTTVCAILKAHSVPRRPGGSPQRLPRPEPKKCANEGCEVVFTPTPAQAARGDGHYCSRSCANEATAHRLRPRTAGENVMCPVCGRSRWYWASDIARGNRFCSPQCWGRYRWEHGLLAKWWLARPLSGLTRQRWIGRWAGRAAGHLGGRPRVSVSDEQRLDIQKLDSLGWGRRAIASRLLLSERAVRNVLEADRTP
jgi:hypothetical protein